MGIEQYAGKHDIENGNSEAEKRPDTKGESMLRTYDQQILEKVAFEHQNVLCLGRGNREKNNFVLAHGAASCRSAQSLKDALLLIREHALQIHANQAKPFGIVLMFDFIEHVPRGEGTELLALLQGILSDNAVLIVNTSFDQYDNGAAMNGTDKQNSPNYPDSGGTQTAAAEMDCHGFTTISLQEYLETCGFVNVTEAHYFIKATLVDETFTKISFLQRWKRASLAGVPLAGSYLPDQVEYPRNDASGAMPITFQQGVLSGITLFTTQEYSHIAYCGGNIDVEAITDLESLLHEHREVVIFDVGGFVGANALVYAKFAGERSRIVVFEPNPYNRNRIFYNLSLNPALESRIVVEKIALSSAKGACEMTLSSNIDAGHSSTSRLEHTHPSIADNQLPPGFTKRIVLTETVDDYIKQSGISPNIIKVDTEGAETMFLQGATDTLQNSRPLFFIEYHSEYCATTCTQLLMMYGYDVEPCQEEDDNRLIVKAAFQRERQYSGSEMFKMNLRQGEQIEKLIQSINTVTQGFADEQDKCRRLEQEVAAYYRQIEELSTQQADLRLRYETLSKEFDTIIHSTSWEWTRPFRAIGRMIKKGKRKK